MQKLYLLPFYLVLLLHRGLYFSSCKTLLLQKVNNSGIVVCKINYCFKPALIFSRVNYFTPEVAFSFCTVSNEISLI